MKYALVIILFLSTIIHAQFNFEIIKSVSLINSTINSDVDKPATYTISFPNGEEVLYVGNTYTCRWTTQGSYADYLDLYYSTDSGNSWIQIATRIPDENYYDWTIPNTPSEHCRFMISDRADSDMSDTDFTIATYGINLEKKTSMLPAKYSLFISPNPFRSSTYINYSVKSTCFVTISIYDIKGREITVISNESKKAGEYSLKWTAKTTGTFFCLMKAGNIRICRKMISIK